MKVFVTGVNGQLGHDVMNSLYYAEIDAIGSDIKESYSGVQDGSPACTMPYIGLDLTDEEKTRKIITEEGINAIIHCAAWTAVDAAEEPENQAIVEKINGEVPGVLARIMKERDGKMLYLSTDYVFSGEGTEPWSPDETNFSPINFYGKTKLMGEERIREVLEKYFIVRIAWVFGLNGKNFIKTMLKVGKSHEEVRVVNDQIGNPTYTLDLAELLVDMICTEKYGNYHATNEGDYISWYDFTKEIYRQAGLKTKVIPVSTEEYGLSKAKRPKNSRLDKKKLRQQGFVPLPDWKNALSRYLEALPEEEGGKGFSPCRSCFG
ncbi:dTDP-4-dehydrorhamnose reductase [Oribacterium parvum ACB1]|uniref:dTDP-4-dehydrorhamnose reductase n=3 Tax=Oribacterium parvum TaxID=1501329 RepID=G9WN54_9FIRM|nr:dTDP-4-dehydrorhamnose reductase [Oribacterium parvum]EHL11220.1 dTDP-4-dehydrorhamnose reductase [Oribacterium parvum ACB1]EJF13464.1 dTDP-4-dehydrorhamnose reductase [Oribacterium parvum ACB8]